ncbi:MAG: BolA family protein [Acidobacteriota bacterium]
MVIATRIREKLETALEPTTLQVLNESGNHNVPAGSESHFRVVVVSEAFAGKGRLQRHRAINGALKEELDGPVHALAIDAWTPDEWAERGELAGQSPDCLGGDGSLPAR